METDYSAQVALFCSVELALLLINYYLFTFAARFFPDGRWATDIGLAFASMIIWLRRKTVKDHTPTAGIIDSMLILISPPFVLVIVIISIVVSAGAHAVEAVTD